METARTLKWVTGSLELVLGIPIMGGLIVMGFAYTPLFVMFVLHILTLIFSTQARTTIYGSIMGLITSLLAWIPILGMLMHLTSAILLMVSASSMKDRMNYPPPPNSF
ncbi:hypothetical protein [Paenibacillus sp. NPDC058071]|uniref:hypothetical protein n=1 Tax=Paenibacillus sp. NPDC058071 TaxID=3346326 RepID=UPI0036DCA113